jgi:hypothetical protein
VCLELIKRMCKFYGTEWVNITTVIMTTLVRAAFHRCFLVDTAKL